MIDLTKKPFNLTAEEIKWVEETKGNMTIEEKIGQLFFLMSASENEMYLDNLLSVKPGGVMFRPLEGDKVKQAHKYLQGNSNIPLFLAANLESGSNGLIVEGSQPGNNMLIAATNDKTNAYKQGEISITEALEVGGNMAFAPVIDINYNMDNPITNTRSYGDDVQKIIDMSTEFVRGVQDNGGSVTIKHFPGDGADSRDQHLACTVNSLSLSDWKETYGKIYQENIDNGATGMMVGHIALPSYFEENNITDEPSNIPASLSKNLITKLVREELGFNGLIMTDATLMAGFGQYGRREDIVPMSIANGNDMFLFTKNVQEDYEFMMDGYNRGIITDERLDEALTRILALKACQKLYDEKNLFKELSQDVKDKNKEVCQEIAKQAVTLVRDDQSLLPLSKDKRIGLLDFTGSVNGELSDTMRQFKEDLENRGFECNVIELGVGMEDIEKMMEMVMMPVKEFRKLADVMIYVAHTSPLSNSTTIRLNYKSMVGLDAPWFVNEIPTMFVSFGSPYHGFEWSDVKTGVNAYDSSRHTISETVEAIINNKFLGTSPVKLDYKPFDGTL